MKLVITVLLIAAAVTQLTAQSHNVHWGTKEPQDRELYRDIISKKSSFMQIVKKEITIATTAPITYINLIDQYTDDNGGTAMLLEGGPGSENVKISFKSKRNHGFNFIVEIWGH